MWFKQIQLFQLKDKIAYNAAELATKLKRFRFRPCPPNLPRSLGWASPTVQATDMITLPTDNLSDELIHHGPIVHAGNHCLMICLQMEEKILPASVIRHKARERIREIEMTEQRKLFGKEKQAIKEDIYQMLMPQAFGKISRVYAYIDTKNHWLIVNTVSTKKTEVFLSFFKNTFKDVELDPIPHKKISTLMADWLQHNRVPTGLTIENTAVFQDPNNTKRIIRCQQQDLFAPSIQGVLKEGCEVHRMQFTWNDQITFTLKDDFSLRSLKYQDAVIELANESAEEHSAESKEEQFEADFMIMTESVGKLLHDLIDVLGTKKT